MIYYSPSTHNIVRVTCMPSPHSIFARVSVLHLLCIWNDNRITLKYQHLCHWILYPFNASQIRYKSRMYRRASCILLSFHIINEAGSNCVTSFRIAVVTHRSCISRRPVTSFNAYVAVCATVSFARVAQNSSRRSATLPTQEDVQSLAAIPCRRRRRSRR